MKVEQIKTDILIPYEKNTKKHNKTQINNVAKSIEQYGFVQPIVIDKNNVVIIGHCRLLASKQLKLKEVPCVRVEDLTEEQVRKLRIVDNKSNESEWDLDFLADELVDLDFSDFEFDFDFDDKKKKNEIEGEVEFSEILGEENNYIVLQFKTEVDWLNAESIFGLETVKSWSTRNDGKIAKNMQRKGVARVLDGAKILDELFGGKV